MDGYWVTIETLLAEQFPIQLYIVINIAVFGLFPSPQLKLGYLISTKKLTVKFGIYIRFNLHFLNLIEDIGVTGHW